MNGFYKVNIDRDDAFSKDSAYDKIELIIQLITKIRSGGNNPGLSNGLGHAPRTLTK